MLGKRILEPIRHGVYVIPEKIYLTRGGKPVKEADGVDVKCGKVGTIRGSRSIVREAEYLEDVEAEFRVEVIPYVLRRLGGGEGLRELFEYGQRIGLGGDRSLGEGKFELVEFRRVG